MCSVALLSYPKSAVCAQSRCDTFQDPGLLYRSTFIYMQQLMALAGPAPHPGSIFHNIHWCIAGGFCRVDNVNMTFPGDYFELLPTYTTVKLCAVRISPLQQSTIGLGHYYKYFKNRLFLSLHGSQSSPNSYKQGPNGEIGIMSTTAEMVRDGSVEVPRSSRG
ncbi:hypothetical protein C8J57DRAFT_1220152 [Mycena rebaudengoi]|nr:hypothetical protein C8J57DRAFT_1220152 [Mycena rebaudengoi]